MSEEDLELLITMDDPGEDTLEEDNFHLQAHGSCCSNTVQTNSIPSLNSADSDI
jgi:hypothetical protein